VRSAPLPVRNGIGPARLRLYGGNVLAEFTIRFGEAAGARVLAGEVKTTSPGCTWGSFSRKRTTGRLVPKPLSRAWWRLRTTQTPTRLEGSVSRVTVAVVGVTELTRPINPPGARTACPTFTPSKEPLPRSNCCHQPPGTLEMTGAERRVGLRVCSCSRPRRRWFSVSSWASLTWSSLRLAERSHSAWAVPGQKGRLSWA
jgi:hypothetical protein